MWTCGKSLEPGEKNLINQTLAPSVDILFTPHLVKFGFVKIFMKSLNWDGKAFAFTENLFPSISNGKIKESVFVGPEIWKIL